MPILDLSHPLEEDMTLFPGTPAVDFSYLSTVEADGWRMRYLRFSSHVGTHLDTPAHRLPDGDTLDDFGPEHFIGSAVVVDVRSAAEASEAGSAAAANPPIHRELLERHAEALADAAFVLLYTGWSEKWKTPDYLRGYPVLTNDAARYLTSLPKFRGVGMDVISPDPADSEECPLHSIFLGARKIIIENLRGLHRLPTAGDGTPVELICLPFSIPQGDGSPTRAVARVG
ncbi:MAG: cyclase family protein [Acidobacteriota bacterium]